MKKSRAVPNWTIRNAIDRDHRPRAAHKALLNAIVSFRNNETGECYPSIHSLALRAGMTTRSVHTLLAELKEWDFIGWSTHTNGSNSYTLYPTPEKFSHKQYRDERRSSGRMVPFTDGTLIDKAKLLDMGNWNKRLGHIAEQDMAVAIGYTTKQLRNGLSCSGGDADDLYSII